MLNNFFEILGTTLNFVSVESSSFVFFKTLLFSLPFFSFMFLKKDSHPFASEIEELYSLYLPQKLNKGTLLFGIVQDDVLKGVAGIKNLYGKWFFRGCVVKPEFRGEGLQKRLIQERLDYLSDKTNEVKAVVCLPNTSSIDNLLASDFVFEKNRVMNGDLAESYVYKF